MASNISQLFNLPFFKVEGNSIALKTTDAVHAAEPPLPTAKASVLEPGPYQDESASKAEEEWLLELGTDFARNFLAVGALPGGDGVVRKIQRIGTKRGQVYYLTAFPRNYCFYMKIRENQTKKSKGHKDAYLLGNGKTWRSPNEFKAHLAWLMAGRPLGYSCACIQCTAANLQEPINKEREKRLHNVSEWLANAAEQGFERPVNALNMYPYLQKQPTVNPGLYLVSQLGAKFIKEGEGQPASSQAQLHAAQVSDDTNEPPSSDTESQEMEVDSDDMDEREMKEKEMREREMMQLAKDIKYNNQEFFRGLNTDDEFAFD